MILIFSSLLAFSFLLYLIAVKKNNFSLIDPFWSIFHVWCVVGLLILNYDFLNLTHSLVFWSINVFLWASRLCLHIFLRQGQSQEDPRYTKFRIEWGENANLHALIKIFLFQPLLAFLIIYPASYLSTTTFELLSLEGLFFGLSLISLLFEAVADRQKQYFRNHLRKEKQQVCEYGLWAYMRHPNYFFEIMFWLFQSLFIVTSSNNLWLIYPSLIVMILLVYITGIPQVNELQKENPLYQDYMKRVKAFGFIDL